MSERDLGADLELALGAVGAAGPVALGHFGSAALQVERKPDRSLVTQADREVEALVRSRIAGARPGDGVIGEELGEEGADRPWRWVVDPIDGTSNFARGMPIWATLLALLDPAGEPVVGVVGAPALGRTWWAVRGGGAWRDGTAMRVSAVGSMADAFVSVSLPDGGDGGMVTVLERIQRAAWRVRGLGDFWQHCLVAEGSLDACVDVVGVKTYDVAAVQVIVEEAGGTFSDHAGVRAHDRGSAMSSNGLLHAALLELVAPGADDPG